MAELPHNITVNLSFNAEQIVELTTKLSEQVALAIDDLKQEFNKRLDRIERSVSGFAPDR